MINTDVEPKPLFTARGVDCAMVELKRADLIPGGPV
jgi:hypothetical protein